MGKVHNLQMFADDPAVTLSVEPGLTDLGQQVTILLLKTGQERGRIYPANYTAKYYFENQSHCLLQQENWIADHLRSKTLVTETAQKKIDDESIVFPVRFVSVSWSSKDKDWRVRTIDTTTLEVQQMPVEKMILEFKDPNLLVTLRPEHHHLRAKREELTPAELDQFSKQLFEEYDKRVRKKRQD